MYAARLNACGLAVVAALLLALPRPASSDSSKARSQPESKIVLEPVSPRVESGPMTFRYRLARPTVVSLTVRHPNGWIVQTLVDDLVAAGEHAVEWDGTDLNGRAARGRAFVLVLRADGEIRSDILVLARSYRDRPFVASAAAP